MPRILPKAAPSSSTPPRPSRLREWLQSGRLLIGLGWTGLVLVVVDRYLQYRDRQNASNMVGMIQEEQRLKRHQLLEESKDKPVLFECVVREAYKMGGTHGLEGVAVGDVVEVLEEAVGPSKYYNLCRFKKDGELVSVGWYPISFLEKKKRRWWFGLLK